MVTLNDSDDSESDGEPSNSTSSVFGGLESMIKEARRNVEVNAVKIFIILMIFLYIWNLKFRIHSRNTELHQKRVRVSMLVLTGELYCNLDCTS